MSAVDNQIAVRDKQLGNTRPLVAPGLQDLLQNNPVLIDGAPELELTPRDHHENLIEMPDIARTRLPPKEANFQLKDFRSSRHLKSLPASNPKFNCPTLCGALHLLGMILKGQNRRIGRYGIDRSFLVDGVSDK